MEMDNMLMLGYQYAFWFFTLWSFDADGSKYVRGYESSLGLAPCFTFTCGKL